MALFIRHRPFSLIETVLELFMTIFSGEGKGGGAYFEGGA